MVRSRLRDLKEEIEEMGKDEKGAEEPNEKVDIAEKILEFSKQNQQGQWLKILTPDQMLIMGIIHKNLKNEIRELLYCLYQFKKINQNNL